MQAMASSNPTLSALFYASAVLLGKYMLLNLLVAILVENYSLVQSDEVRSGHTLGPVRPHRAALMHLNDDGPIAAAAVVAQVERKLHRYRSQKSSLANMQVRPLPYPPSTLCVALLTWPRCHCVLRVAGPVRVPEAQAVPPHRRGGAEEQAHALHVQQDAADDRGESAPSWRGRHSF